MKTTSIMVMLWTLVSSFASHYKQVAAGAAILFPLTSSAQFATDYRPPYKAAFYPGSWSGVTIYEVRDFGDGLQGQFKFYTDVKIAPLASPHNDGSPSNIVWLGADTLLKLSPVGTLSLSATQLTGVSIIGAGATTVTGTGLNLTITTPTVQGNITPTITAAGSATVTTSGNTFTVNTPSVKRQEPLTVTTTTAGIATFTYGSTYSVAPNVQYNLGVGAGNKETIVPQTSTTTGCTFLVQLRSDVLGLLPSYAPVSGREVNIIVTEK